MLWSKPSPTRPRLLQRKNCWSSAAPLGRYDGIALILVGIGLIIIAGLRYARTAQRIDQEQFVRAGSGRTEMILTIVLALLASGFCLFVSFT
jgi:uncharacterized membrane protein YidH (DUF202 family)